MELMYGRADGMPGSLLSVVVPVCEYLSWNRTYICWKSVTSKVEGVNL